MSTPGIMSDPDSTTVCRITVDGPGRSADLGVPFTVTVGALLPVLVDRLRADDDPDGAGYVLQRLGGEPLDPAATAGSLGLRDGETLSLRRADDVLPPMFFDDLADGVAAVVGARPDRWRPELTRRLFVGLGCLTLAVLAASMLFAGSGREAGVGCGVIAVLLLAGCAVVSRSPAADPATVLVTGVAGWIFAALAGCATRGDGRVLSVPGRHELLLGGACAVAASLVLFFAGRVPVKVFGALLVAALGAEIGSCLSISLDWDATTSATVVAVTMFVLSAIAPRVALRLAGLRVPQLPRNADELQEDVEPRSRQDVERRVAAADTCLTLFTVGASVVYAVDLVLLTRRDTWFEWLLALALAGAVALRSRGVTETGQRVALALAGTLGLTLAVIRLLDDGGTAARASLGAILLAAAALLLLAAQRLPSVRLLPIWGHTADILEMVTAIALVPLLLQHLHVYWSFRSLAG
ncbi:type VII secretion integral membrane protein EccD [Streptomyces sp. NBC_00102]|uniref:type VII secretion integral membrane protein EccD n=1 Tax=Streptomyces sp. NBC_00102 TaxID=2975652 RepID=UPI002250BCC8|nr:type VII secretion integral membrane protein EccD [Streptomyces sp. NBC_00102]MCX5401195.1 type VII secretion integral membrane protein EccD [Streptomyces sp. NBC_00102]